MAEESTAFGSSEQPAGKHSHRNKLKKRKKKFIANVKGFGKQGNFGRGTHLESDEWNYFINILDAIKRGFDSMEDKGIVFVDQCGIQHFRLIFFSPVHRNYVQQCSGTNSR